MTMTVIQGNVAGGKTAVTSWANGTGLTLQAGDLLVIFVVSDNGGSTVSSNYHTAVSCPNSNKALETSCTTELMFRSACR